MAIVSSFRIGSRVQILFAQHPGYQVCLKIQSIANKPCVGGFGIAPLSGAGLVRLCSFAGRRHHKPTKSRSPVAGFTKQSYLFRRSPTSRSKTTFFAGARQASGGESYFDSNIMSLSTKAGRLERNWAGSAVSLGRTQVHSRIISDPCSHCGSSIVDFSRPAFHCHSRNGIALRTLHCRIR